MAVLHQHMPQITPLSTTVVTNAGGWYLGSRRMEGGWNHATDG
jgi:hypothetical protein